MPGSDSQQRQSGRSLDSGFMGGHTQTSFRIDRRSKPVFSNASLFSANRLVNVAARRQACDLGLRGTLAEWERLMGATPRR